jgi:hypothetical protein
MDVPQEDPGDPGRCPRRTGGLFTGLNYFNKNYDIASGITIGYTQG